MADSTASRRSKRAPVTWTSRSRTYGELEHPRLAAGHEMRRRAADQYGDLSALFRAARAIAAANPHDIELRARNLRLDVYLKSDALKRRLKAVSKRTGIPSYLSDLTPEVEGLTSQRAC